jgi:hypothetical protein
MKFFILIFLFLAAFGAYKIYMTQHMTDKVRIGYIEGCSDTMRNILEKLEAPVDEQSLLEYCQKRYAERSVFEP